MANSKTNQAAFFKFLEGLEAGREKSKQELIEQIGRDVATVAPDGSMDTTSPEQRMGTPMYGEVLRRKLQRLNPSLRFERSVAFPDKTGIYRAGGIFVDAITHKDEGREFICGMETGIMPEYSILHPEEITVPHPDHPAGQKILKFNRETRGWRSVLAMLLRKGLITQAQINKHFPAAEGKSARWQHLTESKIEVL